MDNMRSLLAGIRESGALPAFPDTFAVAEDVDIEAGLGAREPCSWKRFVTGRAPARIVIIVGAPRSGTSHLFNLLAATGRFAYFTTASCWAWPVRNLRQPGRTPFTALGESAVLTIDNKRTRIIPGLVMPGEAEDIWHRAMPVYRHVRGHRYDIRNQPEAGNAEILDAAASAHLTHFGRDILLIKSPFSSFRIPQLEQHWGTRAMYVHITRDQHETADSIRRNHFEFAAGGRLLNAEDAWALFAGSVQASAPADRTITIRHADMIRDPASVHNDLARQLA